MLRNWYMYPAVYFKMTKKPIIEFETKSGLKLIIRTSNNSTDIHVFTEVWLENEYFEPALDIVEDDVIIDIGAHTGMFSALASQYCKKGKVLSYEPNKENYAILIENVQNNKLENVSAYKSAVSSKSGIIRLYLNKKDFAAHSLYKKSKQWIDVESTTISEIFENNGLTKCDLLKLDCEGAEYDIIMNLPDSYFEKIDKICLEYHNIKENPFTYDDLIENLESHNFSVKKRTISNERGFIYAKQKEF